MNSVIIDKLTSLLGKTIELDGYAPYSKDTKIVAVATSKQKNDFYIGVLPIDGLYGGSTPIELKENEKESIDWIEILHNCENVEVFWIDKTMVENIKDLLFLRELKLK